MSHALHNARTLRKRAAELRYEANALIAGAAALEREEWGPNPIRGWDIVSCALEVLDYGPTHYKVLAEQIEERTGRRIAGADPTATLTAALHRDARVEQLGHGMWRRAFPDEAAA